MKSMLCAILLTGCFVPVQAGSYEDLVKYLIMVRKKAKDSKVDTELVYAYGKTNQLGPLEEFISSPNQANLQVCCLLVASHNIDELPPKMHQQAQHYHQADRL